MSLIDADYLGPLRAKLAAMDRMGVKTDAKYLSRLRAEYAKDRTGGEVSRPHQDAKSVSGLSVKGSDTWEAKIRVIRVGLGFRVIRVFLVKFQSRQSACEKKRKA